MPLKQGDPEPVTPTEWVSDASLKDRLVTYVMWVYGFVVVVTATILFFQGFHLAGFSLDPVLLKGLEVATIGEIGGLLAITFRAIFKSP